MTLFSTFGLFVTLSLLIALIFALIAIMPWLRAPRLQSKPIDNQLLDINVAVFRERLAELQTDKDSGTINNSHYQNQKLELERQLLDVQRQITPMVRSCCAVSANAIRRGCTPMTGDRACARCGKRGGSWEAGGGTEFRMAGGT